MAKTIGQLTQATTIAGGDEFVIEQSGQTKRVAASVVRGGLVNADIDAAAAIAGSKLADGGVTPAKLSQPYTLATAQNSTSGTSIDFTGIPSWAKRITVMFDGVSTNGTTAVQVQLGDSGGFEATGYSVSNSTITGANAVAVAIVSTGFIISGNTAATTRDGALILSNLAGNTWVGVGSVVNAGAGHAGFTQGTKTLSATLDRVRITTVNGTDTFDAGSINISYEG